MSAFTTPTQVVCPLDGSDAAERALPSARTAAALLGAQLHLFSAVEDPHEAGRRTSYLDATAALGSQVNGPAAHIEVVSEAHAPRALGERATSADVLTVMATSTNPLIHNGYVGSAAEAVVRRSGHPVMLVGPHATIGLGDITKVVVPIDGSPESESIVPAAAAWAKIVDAPLWLVTVISAKDQRTSGWSVEAESNAIRRLAEPLGAQWDVLHGDDPADTIVEWANGALIAMTTHGRSGFSRLRFGSVTTDVARSAQGPVLVLAQETT